MPPRKQALQAASKNALPPDQPISLKTMGEYLNLSPATISLVLNNAPGVRSIPQETRDRVLAAARKFDYRPSFSARSLRGKRSFTIGVLMPDPSDGYAVLVMNGVEEVLLEKGYFYLAASHRREADLLEKYPRMLMDRSVEGFITIDTALRHGLSLPVVAIAGYPRLDGVTSILLDQRRAAELALRHLDQLGHRKIAFMRGQSFSADSDDRWKNLMAVAKELEIEVHPELTIQLQLKISSPELGYSATQQLLARKSPFTAFVCYNDVAAIGSIRALRDHNLRVPEDVSVLGFDDILTAKYHNPSLTTIRQPLKQMGSTAARILLDRLRGNKEFPDQIAVLPELVIRESTLPPNPKQKKSRK